jgi:1-acyl-sn-glycerol-3-phosphate acyltransferase
MPGTIIVEFQNPIPPGLDKTAFFRELQVAIEQASARLLHEARNRDQENGYQGSELPKT